MPDKLMANEEFYEKLRSGLKQISIPLEGTKKLSLKSGLLKKSKTQDFNINYRHTQEYQIKLFNLRFGLYLNFNVCLFKHLKLVNLQMKKGVLSTMASTAITWAGLSLELYVNEEAARCSPGIKAMKQKKNLAQVIQILFLNHQVSLYTILSSCNNP